MTRLTLHATHAPWLGVSWDSMALVVTYPQRAASDATAYRSCAVLLVVSVLSQKFAVPGTAGAISLAIVPLLLITAFLSLRGALRVCDSTFRLYMLFLASSAISLVTSSSAQLSLHSWILLLVLQAPLILVIGRSRIQLEHLIGLTSTLGVLFAIAGLAQLALQATLGSSVAFWLDYNLPNAVALEGFNNLNPLFWDVTTYKSNGVFFKEPAFFSQFLAISFLAELWLGGRLPRLITIGAGMLASYSGTGLITLAIFVPFYVMVVQPWKIVLTLAVLVVAAAAASDYIQLDALTSRTDELELVGSSGYARFITPLGLLADVLTIDLKTFLLGRGSGTVTEFFTTRPYGMFDPTYAKLLYEYGAIGFAIYAAVLYSAVLRSRGPLNWPLAFMYLLLGGYLLDPAVITPLAVLGAWSSRLGSRGATRVHDKAVRTELKST